MPSAQSHSSITVSVENNGLHIKPSKSPTLDRGTLSRTIPVPMSCPLARIMDNFLLPNVVTHGIGPAPAQQDKIEVTLSAPMGKYLVAVTLAPGEQVAFNMAYLVAYSQSLKLWTEIEFSWSSFGVGRNFIQNALGPGLLIFEVNGKTHCSPGPNLRFAPSRLVAWTPSIEFMFTGVESLLDIYLNEIMVQANHPSKNTLLLLDADADESQTGHTKLGSILKLLKRAYIPL